MFRSALRRLAVTLPFFTLAGLVLTVFGRPREAVVPSPLVIIVTSTALHPAFDALESWNDAHGCPARVITLNAQAPQRSWTAELAGRFPQHEIRGLLLGGDQAQVPGAPGEGGPPVRNETAALSVVPVPLVAGDPELKGVPVLRAPVRDLAEAWAFFESCRASGQTLDRILADQVASAEHDRSAGSAADLAAVARPR